MIYNSLIQMEVIVLVAILITLGVSYEVLYSLNCGSEMEIKTPLLTFNSDEMYEGLTSKSHKKDSLPSKFNELSDIQLLSYQRTTDHNAFSYFLRLSGADHYLLLMKFIEVAHDKPKDRVFQVWLGEEQLFQIDIVNEIGVGEVLHKFIQFELLDDVLYINKTTPVLNGYIYPKQMMQLTFVKVAGQPKVEALVLLKGADSEKFVREYIQFERAKASRKQQSIAKKYQKPASFAYRHLKPNEWLQIPESTMVFYFHNFLSIDTFLTLLAVAFVFFHEKIYQKLNIPRQEAKDQ